MDGLQSQLGEVAPEGAPRAHRELNGLADGERIDCHYVVRDRSRRPTKKGGEWLALKLSDRSGNLSAKCWDEIEARFAAAEPGTIVRVVGRYECSAQWGDSLIIDTITTAREGDYDPADLLETSPVPLERMESDLAPCSRRFRTPTCARFSTASSRRRARSGRGSATPRQPSITTRPIATGCSSTRSPSPRASAQPRHSSRESTGTSRSPVRSCTTSASSRPTTTTRLRST